MERLPTGPVWFRKVRISPGVVIRFEARARGAEGAAEALRKIAARIELEPDLPKKLFVEIAVDSERSDDQED